MYTQAQDRERMFWAKGEEVRTLGPEGRRCAMVAKGRHALTSRVVCPQYKEEGACGPIEGTCPRDKQRELQTCKLGRHKAEEAQLVQ